MLIQESICGSTSVCSTHCCQTLIAACQLFSGTDVNQLQLSRLSLAVVFNLLQLREKLAGPASKALLMLGGLCHQSAQVFGTTCKQAAAQSTVTSEFTDRNRNECFNQGYTPPPSGTKSARSRSMSAGGASGKPASGSSKTAGGISGSGKGRNVMVRAYSIL